MQTEPTGVPVSKKMLWLGWILTVAPVLMLFMSATMKLLKPPDVVKGFEHL